MSTRIFVYGTLLPGLERHQALQTAQALGPALVQGQLYELGEYPGLRPGEDQIIGEVFDVDAATLEQLDLIENYDALRQCGLYLRRPIEVTMLADGHTQTVQTYRYGTPPERHARHISHGDYRRDRIERQASDHYWVLAYGSNLDEKRLAERVGPPLAAQVGHIPHYQLAFNKNWRDNGVAVANLRFARGQHCPAVAWLLAREQMIELDHFERGYQRVGVHFFQQEKETLQLVLGYIAHPDWLLPQGTGHVLAEYRAFIERGRAEHGLEPLDN